MNRRTFAKSSVLLASQSLGALGNLLALEPGPQAPVTSGKPPSTNWALIPELSDEFSGTSLDATKWSTQTGYPASGVFAFSPNNITVSGGYLNLYARKEDFKGKSYSSAFLESKISDPGNGSYLEVRAKPIDFRANICCAIWEQNFPGSSRMILIRKSIFRSISSGRSEFQTESEARYTGGLPGRVSIRRMQIKVTMPRCPYITIFTLMASNAGTGSCAFTSTDSSTGSTTCHRCLST